MRSRHLSAGSPTPVPACPVLRVSGIEFRRGRPILKGIDWTVAPGENWCILGSNGCGKSSLINIVTGYDSASSGSIEIDGARFGDADWREVRKRVGIVANTLTTLLEGGEQVLEVVASGREAQLNVWEVPPEALLKAARSLLNRIGCGYLAKGRWGHLSQGEKQKVLICRALMAKFRMLILDEPCAGLDPVAREQFLNWMHALVSQPGAPSLIMVTHHVEEILPSISHVLMLRDGEVLAAGKKQQTLTSARLSALYGSEVKLTRQKERYYMRLL